MWKFSVFHLMQHVGKKKLIRGNDCHYKCLRLFFKNIFCNFDWENIAFQTVHRRLKNIYLYNTET